jgi:hypothetical protein
MLRTLVILLILSVAARAQSPSGYTDAMFRRALANHTTAPPLYVLITLRATAGNQRTVCVTVPALLGALRTESKAGLDEASRRKLESAAAEQPGRVFSFTDPNAWETVQPCYTEAILGEVRRTLAGFSDRSLLAQVKKRIVLGHDYPAGTDWHAIVLANCSTLQRLYMSKLWSGTGDDSAKFTAYQDAVAQVLLEHGILVGRGLYVPENIPPPPFRPEVSPSGAPTGK